MYIARYTNSMRQISTAKIKAANIYQANIIAGKIAKGRTVISVGKI